MSTARTPSPARGDDGSPGEPHLPHVDLDHVDDDDADPRHAQLREQLQAALAAVELGTPAIDLDRVRAARRAPWSPAAGSAGGGRARSVGWAVAALAAVAAVLLTVSSLDGARPPREAAPASSSPASVFPALDRARVPADLAGGDGLPDQVQRGSVRLVGATDEVDLWAGSTADGRVCLSAVGTYRTTATCTLRRADADEPLRLQLEPSLADAALTPTGYDTGQLKQQGFVPLARGLWVAAAQAPAAFAGFHRLAVPQQPGDAEAALGRLVPDLLPGSERRLGDVDGTTYWLARDTSRNVCLVGVTAGSEDPGASGSATAGCSPAAQWADGPGGAGQDGDRRVQLVPDGYDTSRLVADGATEVVANLWVAS